MELKSHDLALPTPPRGMTPARVEPKGRLRLPDPVVSYLKKFGDVPVFITSLDGVTARIYPLPVWEHNEKLLQESGPNSSESNHIYFLAMLYGQECSIDPNNRVILPTNLRRDLELEGKEVWLDCMKGRVTILNDSQMKAKFEAARKAAPAALESLESKGLL